MKHIVKLGVGVISLSAILSFSSASLALADEGMRCVQNQMTALGIDVGTVDGVFGKRTANAAKAVAGLFPVLSDLQQLDKNNALTWCREVALQSEILKSHWPTHESDKFEYFYSGQVPENAQKAIEDSMDIAVKYFLNLGISLPGKTKIISGNDLNLIAKTMSEETRNPISRASALDVLVRQCEGKDMSGLNLNGLVVFCFAKETDVTRNLRELKDIAVHEYAHEVQRQMTTYTRPYLRNEQQLVDINGPRWLVEATATAFANDYTYNSLISSVLIALIRNGRDEFSGSKLKTMIGHEATQDEDFASYVNAAGQLLVKKKGVEGILNFWSQMARTDWKDAFQQNYGLTIDEFYVEFDWKAPVNKTPLPKAVRTDGDINIACVQQQFAANSIDVGDIDGILGVRTVSASEELATKYRQLSRLNELTKHNAIAWCRQIGLTDFDMRIYWPSRMLKFKFDTAWPIDQKLTTILQRSANIARKYFDRWQFEPAGSISVLARSDIRELVGITKLEARQRIRDHKLDIDLRQACWRDEVTGINYDGLLSICVPQKPDLSPDGITQIEATFVRLLAQEYLRQASGYSPSEHNEGVRLARFGPVWLYFGMSQALADKYADQKTTAKELAARQSEGLQVLRKTLKFMTNYDNGYIQRDRLSALAAHSLAVRAGGYQSFFIYWDELAKTDWQTAFKTAFGLTPEQFYDEFEAAES